MAFVFFNTLITGEQIGNMAYLFLSAGLLAMGAARVAVLRSLRGGKENPFDRRWLAGLVLSVAGAVGLASLAAALVSGDGAILGIVPRLLVGLVVAAAALVAFPVMLGLLYLLYGAVDSVQNPDSPVFQALSALVGRLQGMMGALFEQLMAFITWLKPVLDFIDGLTPWARVIVLWGVLLGLAGLALLLLRLRERRRRELSRPTRCWPTAICCACCARRCACGCKTPRTASRKLPICAAASGCGPPRKSAGFMPICWPCA